MATAFLAVAACAAAAPLNPAYGEDEFDFYLPDLNAKALIVSSQSDLPSITVARKVAQQRAILIIDLKSWVVAQVVTFVWLYW